MHPLPQWVQKQTSALALGSSAPLWRVPNQSSAGGGGGVSAPWELCPGLYDCLVSLVSPLPKWDSLTGDIILRSFTAALVLLLCSWLSVGQPKYAS